MVSLLERRAFHESGHVTAALVLGVPVISVSIDNDTPHMHRARYTPPHDGGLQTMLIVCLAGPEAETLFCGQISDGFDLADLQMAREYLSRAIPNPLQAAIELARCRVAAERLVRSAWAQQRIAKLAEALLRHGTLRGEEIHRI